MDPTSDSADGYLIFIGIRNEGAPHGLQEVYIESAPTREAALAFINDPTPLVPKALAVGTLVIARDKSEAERVAMFGVVRKVRGPVVELADQAMPEAQKYILGVTRGRTDKTHNSQWRWLREHRKVWWSAYPPMEDLVQYADALPWPRQGLVLAICDSVEPATSLLTDPHDRQLALTGLDLARRWVQRDEGVKLRDVIQAGNDINDVAQSRKYNPQSTPHTVLLAAANAAWSVERGKGSPWLACKYALGRSPATWSALVKIRERFRPHEMLLGMLCYANDPPR